jgi:hypothetical protein
MDEVAIAGITTFSILGAAAVGIIYSIFGPGSGPKQGSDHDAYSEYHAKEANERAATAHADANAADTGSGSGSGRRSRKSRRSRRSKKSRRN